MEIYREDAVKLTVTTITVFYIFGHPVNMYGNITYFCGNMMKVQRPLKCYVTHRNLIYRSNQNGPSPSKKCSFGPIHKFQDNLPYLFGFQNGGLQLACIFCFIYLVHTYRTNGPKHPVQYWCTFCCLATSIYHPQPLNPLTSIKL